MLSFNFPLVISEPNLTVLLFPSLVIFIHISVFSEFATIKDIEIQNSSKRILLGTDEKKIEAENGSIEQYPCVLISGDFNSDGSVNKEDYEMLKDAIKSKSSDSKFDLNIDGKVDITDLSYVHQNINKTKSTPIIVDTDPIINLLQNLLLNYYYYHLNFLK